MGVEKIATVKFRSHNYPQLANEVAEWIKEMSSVEVVLIKVEYLYYLDERDEPFEFRGEVYFFPKE